MLRVEHEREAKPRHARIAVIVAILALAVDGCGGGEGGGGPPVLQWYINPDDDSQ
jgi:hypothetical protein